MKRSKDIIGSSDNMFRKYRVYDDSKNYDK